ILSRWTERWRGCEKPTSKAGAHISALRRGTVTWDDGREAAKAIWRAYQRCLWILTSRTMPSSAWAGSTYQHRVLSIAAMAIMPTGSSTRQPRTLAKRIGCCVDWLNALMGTRYSQ